jgi:ATP-dependent 26S proteasome regulatory subunit
MNMDKKDVTKSIFRDRTKIGSSCADVSPMEVDLKTTFKNVGGRADHINCLKEIVVLPLLYPEIFSKFSIQPPRGGNIGVERFVEIDPPVTFN